MATMDSRMGSAQQPYPTAPASPTLTNPDMILPDDDLTYTPDLDSDRNHSPLIMWQNAHAAASGPDLVQFYGGSAGQNPFIAGPITPTTPIIYGNGTMLSDIGEVTEVESTIGRPSPPRRRVSPMYNRGHGNEAAMQSSPTMGLEGVKRLAKIQASQERLRRSSIDSTSTVTTVKDGENVFADFDDSNSVGDSVFQGDDEESIANSYTEGTAAREPRTRPSVAVRRQASGDSSSSSGSGTGEKGHSSTAALSRRAEEILANAKKRLTTMEGNLSRARSLHGSSSSISSTEGSNPSPPIPLRSVTALGAATSRSPRHNRMGSDNSLRIGLPVNVYPQRSQSALGAAGGYRQPFTGSRSVEQIRASLHGDNDASTPSKDNNSLEPLDEEEVFREVSSSETREQRESAELGAFLSPTFGDGFEDRGIPRSASVTQVRDLKDQMQGLKGKISSLRQQARADSMKRRSLQSLRTPSPFTHAPVDQWYATPSSSTRSSSELRKHAENENHAHAWDGERMSGEEGDVAQARSQDETGTTDEESAFSGYDVPDLGITSLSHPTQVDPAVQQQSLDGALDEAEEEQEEEAAHTDDGDHEGVFSDDQSDSGESFYHDTLQHPLSHEDREDAFDYEHFILHSALGTISQQRLAAKRRDSYSSEDSVETTRGPVANKRESHSSLRSVGTRGRPRPGSAGSSTSVDTFATATEGRHSRVNYTGSGSDDEIRPFPTQFATISERSTPEGTPTAKMERPATADDGNDSRVKGTDPAEAGRRGPAPHSLAQRPASSAATMHRPSVSSFDSSGTVRSFPLVSRKKAMSVGNITPSNPATDAELKSISETLMSGAADVGAQQQQQQQQQQFEPLRPNGVKQLGRSTSINNMRSPSSLGSQGPDSSAAMQMLAQDDQLLVQRLVAGLGQCVLGLGESSRAGADSRMYRKRIDAARRILEGLDLGQ